MANPQLENGYTEIAHELIEAFCRTPLGKTESQIIWAVIRKTYGWKKKSDQISISQLCELTHKSRRMIIYGTQNLESKKIIKVIRKRGRGNINEVNEISLNKNHTEWVVQEKSRSYAKTLKYQKKSYENRAKGVVQEKRGSASILHQGVVQETVKGSASILHPQKQLTKATTTKERTTLSEFAFKYRGKGFFIRGKRLEGFDRFWNIWEDKNGKSAAAYSWLKISPMTDSVVDKICEGAENYNVKRREILLKNGTPKMAQGWLSDERWNDEFKINPLKGVVSEKGLRTAENLKSWMKEPR